MNAPIDIPPPLTCGACGALVDERQAWHPWPSQQPQADGGYLLALQDADTTVYVDIATWEAAAQRWNLYGDPFGVQDAWPIAWRPLPPLPEWVQ